MLALGMFSLGMARLAPERRQAAAPAIRTAFEDAQRATALEQKQIADILGIDEAQMRRQLAGTEGFDLVPRLTVAALEGNEVAREFLGHFAYALAEQAGGLRALLLRAITTAASQFIPRLPPRAQRPVRVAVAHIKEASVA